MKHLILTLVFATLFISNRAYSVTKEPDWSVRNVKIAIEYYADKYDVNPVVMDTIIKKESSYNPYAYNPNDGKNGCHSRGLIQLNSCYMGKGISDDQAYNPVYAIDKLAVELKKGSCRQWSTCPNKKATS